MAKPERVYISLPVRKSGNDYAKSTVVLNEAIKDFKEDKIRIAKINSTQKDRKGVILKFCNTIMDKRIAKRGKAPDGPVSFTHYDGQEVEYILSDKSNQVPLKEIQVERLTGLVGEENVGNITRSRTTYKLNNEVLRQEAKNGKTVESIVFKLLEKAIKDCPHLEEHQKLSILETSENTLLMENFVNEAIPVLGGKKPAELSAILNEVKPQVVRYLK